MGWISLHPHISHTWLYITSHRIAQKNWRRESVLSFDLLPPLFYFINTEELLPNLPISIPFKLNLEDLLEKKSSSITSISAHQTWRKPMVYLFSFPFLFRLITDLLACHVLFLRISLSLFFDFFFNFLCFGCIGLDWIAVVETKKGTISVASAFPVHQEGMVSLDFCYNYCLFW